MSPAEAEALGRRWHDASVSAIGLRSAMEGRHLRAGMLALDGRRVLRLHNECCIATLAADGGLPDAEEIEGSDCSILLLRPDLRDPATRGAALEVVRDRWGDPMMHLRPVAVGWGLFTMRVSMQMEAATAVYLCIAAGSEAEALCAALEAAPKG